MRAILPFILVALALFAALCIAYIAWEVSSEKQDPEASSDTQSDTRKK